MSSVQSNFMANLCDCVKLYASNDRCIYFCSFSFTIVYRIGLYEIEIVCQINEKRKKIYSSILMFKLFIEAMKVR